MARVVVDVMLKPEILDPQGQAIAGALSSLAIGGVRSVRQGKHFELDLDSDPPTAADMDSVRRLAETLLANPVIEDFAIRVESGPIG